MSRYPIDADLSRRFAANRASVDKLVGFLAEEIRESGYDDDQTLATALVMCNDEPKRAGMVAAVLLARAAMARAALKETATADVAASLAADAARVMAELRLARADTRSFTVLALQELCRVDGRRHRLTAYVNAIRDAIRASEAEAYDAAGPEPGDGQCTQPGCYEPAVDDTGLCLADLDAHIRQEAGDDDPVAVALREARRPEGGVR